jgi:hypothetical protein
MRGLKTFGVTALLVLQACPPPRRGGRGVVSEASVQRSESAPADTNDPEYWIAKCKRGNGETCTLVGGAYEFGSNDSWGYFPQDFARAAKFYRLGCDRGDVQACSRLARFLLDGIGVDRDAQAAFQLASNTCSRRNAAACFLAGKAISTAGVKPRDGTGAASYYKRACELGEQFGCKMVELEEGTSAFASAESPEGAAGIRFGSRVSDAQARCEQSGHSWLASTTRENSFMCDGSPQDLGFDAEVRVEACTRGEVCLIAVVREIARDQGKNWLRSFASVEDTLWKKYGQPGKRTRVLPDQCLETVARLAHCLESNSATMTSSWVWEDGMSVFLSLDANAKHDAILVVLYTSREYADGARVNGL